MPSYMMTKSPKRQDMKYIQLEMSIKAADVDAEKGTFTGLASVFDVIDHDGDVIRKGAFDETVAEWAAKGQFPAMFWMHSMAGGSVGDWHNMQIVQNGLEVSGGLFMGNPTEEVRKAYNQVTSKGPKGLSVGFTVPRGGSKRVEVQADDGSMIWVNEITKVKLWEVSVVPFGANSEAVITSAKAQGGLLYGGEVVSIKQAEAFLREVGGLSNQQAKALLAGGYGRLNQREVGELEPELVKSLSNINQLLKEISNA